MVIQKSPRTGYGMCVSGWLDRRFPDRWIGLCLPVEWSSRSPHLTPLDFYLWKHFKTMMYQVKTKCGPQWKVLEALTETCWPFEAYWLLDAPIGLTFSNSRFCTHTHCIYLRTNVDIALYNKYWLVFIIEMKSVYRAVGTGSVNKTFYSSSVTGYCEFATSGRDASVCAINVFVPYRARFVNRETILFMRGDFLITL